MHIAPESLATFVKAIEDDDHAEVRRKFGAETEVRGYLDGAGVPWAKPLVTFAKTPEMVDTLLDLGASVDRVTEWWAPGFGVIAGVETAVGERLLERGATATIHALCGLGLAGRVRAALDEKPELLEQKGGDGGRPLHFARTVEVAKLLVERGAELDPRDDDHDSRPVQWLVDHCKDVCRFLVERGATPDIFLAAALGDLPMTQRLVKEDPGCVEHWIGDHTEPFPGIGYQGRGGTIYQWTLAFNVSPHQIAAKHSHDAVFEFLWNHSPQRTRFLVACCSADRAAAEEIASENPDIVSELDADQQALLAKYCWETNADVDAVRLMLDLGFPLDATERNHGHSPIHNAAWGGYGDLVDLLLERGAKIDGRDPDYDSTPLGWAIHCCVTDGRHPEGEYGRVAKALLAAGSPFEATVYPCGNDDIDAALLPHLKKRLDGRAALGDGAGVEELLGSADAGEKSAALLAAAHAGHVGICKRLAESGADIHAKNRWQRNAVHVALQSGDAETVEYFVEQGVDVRLKNRFGAVTLHAAAYNGASPEVVELLLRRGADADVNCVNDWGAAPLDAARSCGEDAIAELLVAHGAKTAAEIKESSS